MNRYDFTLPGGFPLDQGVLDFVQDCIGAAAQTAALAGPLAILSGCVITGPSASDGWVVINNEILPFQGGLIQAKVIIHEDINSLEYQDTESRPAQYERYATFGDDGITDYEWINFKRNTTEGVLSRLESLEAAQVIANADIDSLQANAIIDEGHITTLQNTKATKLASGTLVVGNVPDVGGNYIITFPTELPDTNYLVITSIVSKSADPSNDLVNTISVISKTRFNFTLYLHEPGALTQNINIDWIVFGF